jgi:hypothetical protein
MFPTDPGPPLEFVKINRAREHQQARGDEFLASTGEPANQAPPITPAHSVRTSSRPEPLAEMINQRLQSGPCRGPRRHRPNRARVGRLGVPEITADRDSPATQTRRSARLEP